MPAVARSMAVLVLVLFAPAAFGSSLTIEGTEYPSYIPIDTQFASQGVVFSSTMGYVTFGTDGGRLGIYGTGPSGSPGFSYAWFNEPIHVTFVDPADGISPGFVNGTVSAVWGDGGGDTDLMRMRMFDVNGVLIDTVFGSTVSFSTISYTGVGIHEVIFDQQPGAPYASDTFLDSLTFPTPVHPIPEPGTLALIGASAIGLALRLRRRR